MPSEYFEKNFRELVNSRYPYLQRPAVIQARVLSMSKVGERTWMYDVKPVQFDYSDAQFPTIPGIKSHLEVEAGVGGIVAVALIGGRTNQAVIIDEVFT